MLVNIGLCLLESNLETASDHVVVDTIAATSVKDVTWICAYITASVITCAVWLLGSLVCSVLSSLTVSK